MRLGWSRAAVAEQVEGDGQVDRDEQQDSTPYELAAIELLTVDGSMAGWIATEGARTSDWLNGLDHAPIHGLGPRDGAQTAPPSLPIGSPVALERDRIVWVIPPPLPANRHLRLHRRRVRVRIELDDYHVVGQVHVRPGADANDSILRGTRVMVPLTDVEVTTRDEAHAVEFMPVLIVNATHVRRLIADGSHSTAPARDPAPVPPATPPVPPPTPVAEASEARAPQTPESPGHALVVLLEAGVIDVVEFQQMRARIGAAPH